MRLGDELTFEVEDQDELVEAPRAGWFARPIIAVPALIVTLFAGAWLVSSQETMPVPLPEPDRTDEERVEDLERAQEVYRQLAALGLSQTIAYRSVNGIVTVDLSSGEFMEFTALDQVDPNVPGRFRVLSDGVRNVVVDQDDLARVGESVIEGQIGSTNRENRFVAVVDGAPAVEGQSQEDGLFAFTLEGTFGLDSREPIWVNSRPLDAASEFFFVPGSGAVIWEPGSESFWYDSSGYSSLSDHQVVAASSDSRIELRCAEACLPWYVGAVGDYDLPTRLVVEGRANLLSPDGRWLLSWSETVTGDGAEAGMPNEMFSLVFRDVLDLIAAEVGAPSWSADSSFVAWLDPNQSEPRLEIRFTTGLAPVSIDLAAIGAVDRDGDELILLESS